MNLKEYLLRLKEKILGQQENEKLSNETVEKLIHENEMQLEPKTDEELNEILENSIKTFFPEKGNWWSTCFDKPKEYVMRNLPCHLRDNKWLAKMLQIKYNLSYISFSKILDFINNSKLFNELRHNYELEIVRWQIDWMRHGGENWIIDESLGGDEFDWTPLCDIAFRKGIVDTLTAIGMNHEVIEEGIEKNSNMWRDSYMSLAFDREFNNDILWYDIEPAEKEHKENWLKMRRYEYYHKHKKSVDNYGIVLPEMAMSDEEAAKLHIYLTRKNAERKNYIEECKVNPSKKKTLNLGI